MIDKKGKNTNNKRNINKMKIKHKISFKKICLDMSRKSRQ